MVGIPNTKYAQQTTVCDTYRPQTRNIAACALVTVFYLPMFFFMGNMIIGKTKVVDISVLKHLPNLRTLYLAETKVSDISVLEFLANLEIPPSGILSIESIVMF